MSPVLLIVTLIAYLAMLFWIARIADRRRYNIDSRARHPLVYTLALGVYCTSWTFYGLVGTAATHGWDYLPILLGPVLLFTLGFPVVQRIARICQQENLHSIADFIASRYGKRQAVAVVVTVIILFVTIPYIALQLKAVSDAMAVTMSGQTFSGHDLTLIAAVSMIVFALLFGANRLDVASYHSGIMAAIAFESLVKLIALVALAVFALLFTQAPATEAAAEAATMANEVFSETPLKPSFWVLTLVAACSVFCLPRMFQVTFVECLSENHLKFARKGFTLYMSLTALSIFVIAWVGNTLLAGTSYDSDHYVLALPLFAGNKALGVLAFIGGFSAATAMIIVASLTLSQMLSNDVILPLLIRARKNRVNVPDYTRSLKLTRRSTVVAIIALAWLYHHALAENAALTEIGLIAFTLVVQLAPAILFGLYWQRANAVGVFAGLAAGTTVWFITLMVPLLAHAGWLNPAVLEQGLFGLSWLRPTALFGMDFSDDYTRGAVLSLLANAGALVWASRLDIARLPDHIQAIAFVNRERTRQDASVQGLRINRTDLASLLSQFLGKTATQRLLDNDQANDGVLASASLLKEAEQALAGIIGVASTRAMLVNLSSGESLGVADVVNIFEETTRTLQFNQDMLFASFESISSAISVVNADLKMVAWNRRYEQMFNYPEGMLRVGKNVAELVRFNAERGMLGAGSVEQHVKTRLDHLLAGKAYRVVRNHHQGVIEIKGRPLPAGGYVTTYDDITEFIEAQNELEKANLNLEQRVHERTQEIENINRSLREEIRKREETEQELLDAKSLAESANANKTQFLASASHDILQPLNAANLYASALLERPAIDSELKDNLRHLHNAIGSAESIISNLLEISRLDTGALKPQIRSFALNEILEPLANEFRVQTRPEVELRWLPTCLWTESDPKFLRRILQNFVANAVKYTEQGRILLACKRRGEQIEIRVCDTGPGISEAHQQRIFDDFYRIHTEVEGAGLGLGIALRFSQLLHHRLALKSQVLRGSGFSVWVPSRDPSSQQSLKTAPLEINSGLEDLHVFYVDDDENNIHALKTLMQNWGCRITSAATVASARALARASTEQPDALLLDYQLDAQMNGIELAEHLREVWGSLPVCIVSAAPDDNLTAALAHNNFDFLRKPIKPSKLRALMERYSGGHR